MVYRTSDNFENIKEYILEIYHDKLREVIVDYFNDDDYYNIKNYDNINDLILDEIIQELFNTETCNVLKYHGYSYDLDTYTFIQINQYIQKSLNDDFGDNEIFGSLFDDAHQTETKVINMFCYLFCKEECLHILNDYFSGYRILRNIIITQNNQKKK